MTTRISRLTSYSLFTLAATRGGCPDLALRGMWGEVEAVRHRGVYPPIWVGWFSRTETLFLVCGTVFLFLAERRF
jgi:hypothetical protein